MDLSTKIDVLEGISSSDFKRFYFDKQRPAIIKGLAKNQIAGNKINGLLFSIGKSDIVPAPTRRLQYS